jgi:ERCC4-type nuclease
MLIKIDTRENTLFTKIKQLIDTIVSFKEINIVLETLLVGDVIIYDESTNTDILIIERKSINDLLSSIKDGRYEEQSYRLNGLDNHNHNIIYLIEGTVSHLKEKQTVYSAMFSLLYYKGFSVTRSFNIDETAIIICNMVFKLMKESVKYPYYSNEPNANIIQEPKSDKDYINVIKKCKKDNITSDNINEIMLSQIPGISSVTAIAIINKYKSISQLIKELELNIDCLNDITYINNKGQQRKINKTSATTIVKYLIKI